MALPVITAVNQTASPKLLTRIGLTVPASGSLVLSDFAYRHEIWSDESLYNFIVAGDIKISYGQGAVSVADSLKLFNLNPQQPVATSVTALGDSNIASLSGSPVSIDGVLLVTGDRVLLTGQTTASQNGIYVIQAGAWVRPDDFGTGQSAAGTLVSIEGGGTVYKNQVWTCSAIAGSDVIGTNSLTFVTTTPSTSTLQTAYEAGNTINATAGEGNIAFTLTSADFTVNGANDVDFGGTTALSTFNVDSTGAVTVDGLGLSFDGTAASNLSVTGAGLTVSTITSGTLSVTSAGALTMSGAAASSLTTSAGALTVTSAAAATWSTAAGTLSIAGAAALELDSNAGALEINATGGAINIGNDADNQAINIGQGGTRAITIGTGTSPVTIGGDLIVTGTAISAQSEIVNIADQTLYLNAGYETVSAVTGGLCVNYLPTATNDTVAAGGFTAGVAAVSNPTVATTAAAAFAVGQLIQIAGTTNVQNSGLFEVLSSAANVLTIRGVGLTGTVEDFTQNQFVTSAGAVGTIRRVTISVMRTGTDGIWETGSGSSTPIVFTDLASTTSTTLQQAYVNGNTITATAGEGDIAFTLTSADFTVNGANDVDFGGTTAISTFNVDATGSITVDGAGVSIDGTAASNFSTTASNLTLATITSGTLAVSSAGALNLSGTTGDWQSTGAVTIDSSGGTISIGADADAFGINIGTGAAARAIVIGNGTGATSIGISSGTGAINIGANAVAHQINIGNQTGATGVVIDSGTGAISIGTGSQARSVNLGTGGAQQTVTIGSVSGASTTIIDSGTGAIDIGTGNQARSINIGTAGGAAQTVTMGSISTTSSTTINAGTGNIDIGTTAQARSTNIATGAAAQTVTIGSGTGASSVAIVSGTGAINVGTNAVAHTVTVGNNTGATAVIVNSGTEQVQIDGVTYYGNSAGNPTARAGGFQDGDHYYDTTIDMEMRYDSTRAKWLSVEAAFIYFGRNGSTPTPGFYRGSADGLVMSSTSGFYAAYNGTIVGLGYTRADTDAATFDVVESGTSRATLASSAVAGVSNALDGNFSQGGILAVANQTGGNITTDVSGWVKVKWRAT